MKWGGWGEWRPGLDASAVAAVPAQLKDRTRESPVEHTAAILGPLYCHRTAVGSYLMRGNIVKMALPLVPMAFQLYPK